jgi:hypothetical protein
MAALIELVGAPGTGKSTLVDALVTGRGARRPSVGPPLVDATRLVRAPRRAPRGEVPAWPVTGGPLVRGLADVRGLSRLVLRVRDRAELWGLLATRHADWGEFLALTRAAAADDHRDPAFRALASGWLAQTLQLRALADRVDDPVVCLLAEGLVQRRLTVLGSPADPLVLFDPGRVATYLATMPLPGAVVHLTAAPDVVAARLAARSAQGGSIVRHAGLDDARRAALTRADTEALAEAVAAVASRGVRVVTIDTGVDDLASSVARVRALAAAI